MLRAPSLLLRGLRCASYCASRAAASPRVSLPVLRRGLASAAFVTLEEGVDEAARSLADIVAQSPRVVAYITARCVCGCGCVCVVQLHKERAPRLGLCVCVWLCVVV